MMEPEIVFGVLIPFAGTSLGAASALLMKSTPCERLQHSLTGFAAGVMTAAAIWSLILPAMEQSVQLGRLAFLPAVAGFWAGILFLLLLDKTVPHLHTDSDEPEGLSSHLKKTTMLIFAVTLHNIPEGMAVGIVYAGWHSGSANILLTDALVLALGIAIQNFPEGAIISLPLQAKGMKKGKAVLCGILSGAVEPLAAIVTIWLAGYIIAFLPYLLSFAAGAMMYVVVEELIPEMSAGRHSNLATILFSLGFTLMLALDTALG